jgi:hypothetical protein
MSTSSLWQASQKNQMADLNRSVTIDTTAVSLYLSTSLFSIRFFPLSDVIERIENVYIVFFGRSNGG